MCSDFQLKEEIGFDEQIFKLGHMQGEVFVFGNGFVQSISGQRFGVKSGKWVKAKYLENDGILEVFE